MEICKVKLQAMNYILTRQKLENRVNYKWGLKRNIATSSNYWASSTLRPLKEHSTFFENRLIFQLPKS